MSKITSVITWRQSDVFCRFMRHNQGRNVDSVREVFYEGPVSQVRTLLQAACYVPDFIGYRMVDVFFTLSSQEWLSLITIC